MALAVRNRRVETHQDGAILDREAQGPSQHETHAASFPTRENSLPTGETASDERRGPMRPGMLTPSRSRLRGWTLSALFRAGDILAITASVVVATQILGWGVARTDPFTDLAPFALAGAVLAWALG